MRKFVFIYLLVSFFVSPFTYVLDYSCNAEENSHICKMHDEAKEHDHAKSHCHGCHMNINLPDLVDFKILYHKQIEFVPNVNKPLLSFNLNNNLYRPPIA